MSLVSSFAASIRTDQYDSTQVTLSLIFSHSLTESVCVLLSVFLVGGAQLGELLSQHVMFQGAHSRVLLLPRVPAEHQRLFSWY